MQKWNYGKSSSFGLLQRASGKAPLRLLKSFGSAYAQKVQEDMKTTSALSNFSLYINPLRRAGNRLILYGERMYAMLSVILEKVFVRFLI